MSDHKAEHTPDAKNPPDAERGAQSLPDINDPEAFKAHVRSLSKKSEEAAETDKQLELIIPDEAPFEPDLGGDQTNPAGTENPDEQHRLRQLVRKDLMAGLPEGEDHKELRDIVYEEVNDFLTRGNVKDARGIRGADSRTAYIVHLRQALRAVRTWRREGGAPYDIWETFRGMSEAVGFKKKQEGPLSIDGTLDGVLRAATREEN